MSDAALRVVQFIHPGFEYALGTSSHGVMPWKDGNAIHNRKFLVASGSAVEWPALRDHREIPLVFWGEWEGPSVYWRVASSGKPMPSFLHAPFRPERWPEVSVQNTDPMVFGDAFIYSNCLQPAFRSLRSLTPGSIVLFGRYGRERGAHSFGLDTCLVIDDIETLPPGGDGWGDEIVSDAVLRPLASEGARDPLTVYSGRCGPGAPFSFFPARRFEGAVSLFARPTLEPSGALAGVINTAKNQGIKGTSDLNGAGRDAIWAEVARQVSDHGCHLGYHAALPPLISVQRARVAADHPAAPLAR
jgi:hypothetical protein